MKILANLKFMLLSGFTIILTGCELISNEDVNNESKWTQVGTAFNNIINDVLSDNNGKIYVSGGEIGEIMVWDGAGWNKLGSVREKFSGGIYGPITIDHNGNVLGIGRINLPDVNSTYNVAKWNKSLNTWENLTNNGVLFDNGITALVVDRSGNVYAAGDVLNINGINPGKYIYKWDGSLWSNLGGRLLTGYNLKLHIDKSDNLYASMGLNDNGSPFIVKWNGNTWDELGGKNSSDFGLGQISCINSDSQGNVYGGGYFTDGSGAYNICKWTKETNTSSEFYTFESSSDVNSIAFDTGDTLYVAGNFTNSKNQRYIAKYHTDRKLWSDYWNLGANNIINSICFDNNGNLYAGGEFTNKDKKYYVAVYKKR